MKMAAKLALLLGAAMALAEDLTPVTKVMSLLADLRGKVVEEGKRSATTYAEFSKNCDMRIQALGFQIKDGQSSVESDKAKIEQAQGVIKVQEARITELNRAIAKNQAALKAASAVRANETSVFLAQEKELMEMAATIQRAISILARKGPKASLAQVSSSDSVTKALEAMVQASALGVADAGKLTALVQAAQSQGEGEDAELDLLAVPKASATIISVLEDLLSKATSNLQELRKAEVAAKHNYAMVKQSLEAELKAAQRDLKNSQQTQAAARESLAQAQGDLSRHSQQLKQDTDARKSLQADCKSRARDYTEEVKDRKDELVALDKAVQILKDTTGAAAGRQYGGAKKTSFLQMPSAKFEAVHVVQELAERMHSAALMQLAAHMSAAVHLTGGADPFVKVKGLIKGMLAKLQAEAKAEQSHKAFCDKEMKKTTSQQGSKQREADKLQSRIDVAKSRSANLKQEVVALKAALAEISKMQASMDKVRAEEKANFKKTAPEMEMGIKGVQLAIGVIRDFYAKMGQRAKGERAGASQGIVGMLEVVEADFSKNLAELKASEANAAKTYKHQTQKNTMEVATKRQEVKFKTKEAGELDVTIAQIKSDKATVKQELDSITEYLEKLKAQCIAKPEPFEERQKRREQEIQGLKTALEILSGQALLQLNSRPRALRGG